MPCIFEYFCLFQKIFFESDSYKNDGLFESSEQAQGFLSWVERTRYYLNKIAPAGGWGQVESGEAVEMGLISEKDRDEYFELREIGFIFHENLAHYFMPGNVDDRQYLRDMLDEAHWDAIAEGLY